jgi:hypothetical protein
VDETPPDITIQANLEGSEAVASGFERMGDSAVNMGRKVGDSAQHMSTNYRTLMMTSAGVIANSVQLGDIMDRMSKGQMDVGRGAIMLGMNFMQLGGQLYMLYTRYGELIAVKATNLAMDIREVASDYAAVISKGAHTVATWALVAAEQARAIAHAIANALAGPWGWAILAGAAAAAAVGLSLALTIPHAQEGALVMSPNVVSVAESEPEMIIPLSKLSTPRPSIVNHFYIQNPTFRTRGDLDYLVDRLKRMGMA